MKKLILVCGPAGIGKSTFCRKYEADHPDEEVKIIAADEVRMAMTGGYDKFPPNHNMMVVYERMIELAEQYFSEGGDNLTIMMDTTMLYDERRSYFLRNIRGYERKELFLLKVKDVKTCLERNHLRKQEKWVPEEVIIDMYNCYKDPAPEVAKQFDEVKTFYVD
ncbi:MAG: ATP-binding protein [Bacillota bacterium]|nr:ATP-binding protein [Bacillota bacterium]